MAKISWLIQEIKVGILLTVKSGPIREINQVELLLFTQFREILGPLGTQTGRTRQTNTSQLSAN